MATPQNPNGVYLNTVSNNEPSNLCCYKTTFPQCLKENIFLSSTVIETEGQGTQSGAMSNIAAALRDLVTTNKLLALDTAIAPNINPALTPTQRTNISTNFKALLV